MDDYNQREIDINSYDFSILDFNKGEKLIIEFNNLICLGQYELSRCILKEIILIVPKYFEYLYKLIFKNGIPKKWLLNNRIRTSANYIWLFYNDYINKYKQIYNCPKINFSDTLLKSNEFDLLITKAYYDSYEKENNEKLPLNFFLDLRNFFNYFQCEYLKEEYYLPDLRILSPDINIPTLYQEIKGNNFKYGVRKLDYKNSFSFFSNIRTFILTQPENSSIIIKKITDYCSKLNRKESIFLEERIHSTYVSYILNCLYENNYEKIYEYLKIFYYNDSIILCQNFTTLLLGCLISIYDYQENNLDIDIKKIQKFITYLNEQLTVYINQDVYLTNFFSLNFFTKRPKKYHNKLNINKIYESLLGHPKQELFSKLKLTKDYYIEFNCKNEIIPYFLKLKYNDKTFFNNYLNFLRINKEHLLGYPIKKTIKFINNKDYENAEQFLIQFSNLKLLAIILVWLKYDNDINTRKKILEVFFEDNRGDDELYIFIPFIKDVICYLQNLCNISTSFSSLCNISENSLYSKLLNNSLPYVLIKDLKNIKFEVIENDLIQNFINRNVKLQKKYFHEMMIIYSFYYYSFLLEKLDKFFHEYDISKSIEFSLSKENINELNKILNKIILYPYRLNIIQNLFNLIFIDLEGWINLILKEKNINIDNIKKYDLKEKFYESHKHYFIEILLLIRQSLDCFKYKIINLKVILKGKYLDYQTKKIIDNIDNIDEFLMELELIDENYIKIKKNKKINYIDYINETRQKLLMDIDELTFRFNTSNNPWIEKINLISYQYEDSVFLQTNEQNKMNYFNLSSKLHDYNTMREVINYFFFDKEIYNEKINNIQKFDNLKNEILVFNEEKLNELTFEEMFNLSFSENLDYKSAISFIDNSLKLMNDYDKLNIEEKHFLNNTIISFKSFQNKSSQYAKNETFCHSIINTKNIGIIEYNKLVIYMGVQKNKENSIETLNEKINLNNSEKISYEELKDIFFYTYTTIEDSEKEIKTENKNYLKIFLKYIMDIGDIYFNSKKKIKEKSIINYISVIKKLPKTIISKLFFKYDSLPEAFEVAKLTHIDFIKVLFEYTNFTKIKIVKFKKFYDYIYKINEKKNVEEIINVEIPNAEKNKKYKISISQLEFLYNYYINKDEFYYPFWISLYRYEYDNNDENSQIKFWILLIDKYSKHEIYGSYVRQMFLKFYLYMTLLHKNEKYKTLLDKIENFYPNNLKKSKNYCKKIIKIIEEKENKEKDNSKLIFPKIYDYMKFTNNNYLVNLKEKTKLYLENKIKKKNYINNINNKNSDLKVNFQQIHSLSFVNNIDYYKKLCLQFIEKNEIEISLEIFKRHLNLNDDEIAEKIILKNIENKDSESKIKENLLFLKNKEKILKYLKMFFNDWKTESILSILYILQRNSEIQILIDKFETLSEIQSINNYNNFLFKQMEENCEKDFIEKFLNNLMDKNRHDICHRILKIYNYIELYKDLIISSEIKILLNKCDILNKIKALEKINELDDKISFCISFILESKNFENKLLLIEYLLKNYYSKINNQTLEFLKNRKISIQMYFLIPEDLQDKIVNLYESQNLMIEFLLINQKFEILDKIFNHFPLLSYQSENLILEYCKKALDISNEKIIEDDLISIITFNQNNIIQLRKNFKYNLAPNFNLFKRLIQYCSTINAIIKTCLEICDYHCLKLNIKKRENYLKLLSLEIIDKVLTYSYALVNKEKSNDNELKMKLTIYQKLNDLFRIFLYEKIDNFIHLDFKEFFQNLDYKINIRDKLLENDFINIAENYCKEFNIDSTIIDKEIAFFSLKNRDFEKGRLYFKKILFDEKTISSNDNFETLSKEETLIIVEDIIKISKAQYIFTLKEFLILESLLLKYQFQNNLKQIKDFSKEFLFDKSKMEKYTIDDLNKFIENEKKKIIYEVAFYVSTYGTFDQLINYYIENNMFVELIQFIEKNNKYLGKKFFLDQILNKFYLTEKFKIFITALKYCSDHNKSIHLSNPIDNLIKQLILFLSKENARIELLLSFETLEHYLEASLESLKLSKETNDKDKKLEYYKITENNMSKVVNSNKNIVKIFDIKNGTGDIINKKIDSYVLNKLLKSVSFQIKIMEIKKDIPYNIMDNKEDEIYKICQLILISNNNLVLEIISGYSLDLRKFVLTEVNDLMREKQFDKFEKFMEIISQWGEKGILIKFNENKEILWNDILVFAVSQLNPNEEQDKIFIKENLIPRMLDEYTRMHSLYVIGEYENAYILAYQLQDKEMMDNINNYAKKNNNLDLIKFISDFYN